ncbi:MAG: hypothetical protein HOW97_34075 [Catenulispora sp.]|nr:hypothetical protein [Catenulispora sp.]
MSAYTLTLAAPAAVAIAWAVLCHVVGIWWPEDGDGSGEPEGGEPSVG